MTTLERIDDRTMTTTIDTIDAMASALFDGDRYHDRAENGERLAEALQPIIPVLRFWLEASDRYRRELGLANTPAATISRCQAADEALLVALGASKVGIRIDDPETRAVWETAKRARAEVESWPAWKRGESVKTWCPQCGPRVPVDEDGCCASCGADATGEGADQASVAHAELTRIRRELANLTERLEDTFRGGYSDPRDVEIFRHGMGTAATCVAAVLAGERNQAPDVRDRPIATPATAEREGKPTTPRQIGYVKARDMTDDELRGELKRLDAAFVEARSDEEGHGGSPGESVYEDISEVTTEMRRRGIRAAKETPDAR